MHDRTTAVGVAAGRAGFAEAVRAEWVKFRTVRGTVIATLVTITVGVLFGFLLGSNTVRSYLESTPAERADFDPMMATLRPFIMAMIAVAVIGVLAVTSEYASGTIRVSAVAVPSRPRLFAAKTAVVGAVVLAAGQVTTFLAFFVSQSALARANLPSLTLAGPGVMRAVAGGGLCLTLMALFGVAIGFLVRFTSGAVAITTVVTILPALADALFPEWLRDLVVKYWPSSAGLRMAALRPNPDLLTPGAGFALLSGYVAVLLLIALTAFRTRDV
ncbi:hypothetical protein AB0K60_16170 [Thermopolyspora sp. NPDC052614]|uniref:hypothetical protein n=1 Tax=Thermopolyspora sp. NPDC052614 TaxID=3155682 RepID=UPI003432D16F